VHQSGEVERDRLKRLSWDAVKLKAQVNGQAKYIQSLQAKLKKEHDYIEKLRSVLDQSVPREDAPIVMRSLEEINMIVLRSQFEFQEGVINTLAEELDRCSNVFYQLEEQGCDIHSHSHNHATVDAKCVLAASDGARNSDCEAQVESKVVLVDTLPRAVGPCRSEIEVREGHEDQSQPTVNATSATAVCDEVLQRGETPEYDHCATACGQVAGIPEEGDRVPEIRGRVTSLRDNSRSQARETDTKRPRANVSVHFAGGVDGIARHCSGLESKLQRDAPSAVRDKVVAPTGDCGGASTSELPVRDPTS
jgi:hypothetical protein